MMSREGEGEMRRQKRQEEAGRRFLSEGRMENIHSTTALEENEWKVVCEGEGKERSDRRREQASSGHYLSLHHFLWHQ